MREETLISEPLGSSVFQVWGDALLHQGDDRGQLVQLSRQRPSRKILDAIRKLVAKHPEWTLGCAQWFDVEFKDGFIDAMVMRPQCVGDELESEHPYGEEPELPILHKPISWRMRRFSADTLLTAEGNHGCWGEQASTLTALQGAPRPWLRTLELDRWMMTEPLDEARGRARLSHRLKRVIHEVQTLLGSLASLWQAAPRLEHLVIAQALPAELGNIDAPHLRTLCLGLTPTETEQLESLADANVPKLSWLELRLTGDLVRDQRQVPIAALERALKSPALGRLEHLALLGTGPSETSSDGVLELLAKWSGLERLHSLDLGGLQASREAWRAFVGARPSVKKLWVSKATVPDPEWLEAVLPVEWRAPEGSEQGDYDEERDAKE